MAKITKKSGQAASPEDSYASSTIYAEKMAGITGDDISSTPDAFSSSYNDPGAKAHPKGKAHALSAEDEYRYWENNYVTRDYIDRSLNFEKQYAPAYRYGIEAYSRHGGRPFEQIDEPTLRNEWEQFKDESQLAWEHVKDAVRDAYNRLFESDDAQEDTKHIW